MPQLATILSKVSNPHSKNAEFVCGALEVDPAIGLGSLEVINRLNRYGQNQIPSGKTLSAWQILADQFANLLMLLLAVAGGFSLYLGEHLDAMAILVVILINAAIGFFMELQAQKSMEALKKLAVLKTKVLRNGLQTDVPASELVPGDILFLEAGDMVLADARLLSETQLQTNEATLTGESLPVDKLIKPVSDNAPLAERFCMVYRGTLVSKGNSRAVVTATGLQTELGQIADLVHAAKDQATPLEEKLRGFSHKLIKVTLLLVVLIIGIGLYRGLEWTMMIRTAIALAVSAIPEGLPIVATLALARGMLRLAKQQVIVKRLESVETLGGTNVICTDKTGTLTQNQIEVNTVVLPTASGSYFQVTKHEIGTEGMHALFLIGMLCNTATLSEKKGDPGSGDPLEIALLRFGQEIGHDSDVLKQSFPKIKEEPFTSETRMMATMHANQSGYFTAAKGAAEEMIAICNQVATPGAHIALDENLRNNWLLKAEEMAATGLRVLAFAFRETTEAPESNIAELLVLAGLVGFVDPPRSEVAAAIEECHQAGIKVVMITGDHPATALYIARQLGIATSGNENVITGSQMPAYEQATLQEKQLWTTTPVFARVSPKQKLDLVSSFQEQRFVVGMTGDGVNDTPALKKADIGIAMGKSGSQAAQEVADMVLQDDSFTSIVAAVKQGRIIFDNIRNVVLYLLSSNLSELMIVALVAFLHLQHNLFPLQILFINLLSDVFPALALGVATGEPNIMKRKPFESEEPILRKTHWIALLVYSFLMMTCIVGPAYFYFLLQLEPANLLPERFNNILFYGIIWCSMLHVFNMSSGSSFFRNPTLRNPFIWLAHLAGLLILVISYFIPQVREALYLFPLRISDFLVIIGSGFLFLFCAQLLKRLRLIW